uniref:Cyclin N-terminal domain-containing protein n=1 Tax=Lactuca sativa TaxID=4236 RepID=A0A9R1W653_LACSA|nr:hypothetical protein LSAT_V11C300137900 [Lactuca sativa]
MVLCHRFFCLKLIATAALFLAANSEETPCPLNDDWIDEYRERVLEAEQMVLKNLNFELNVQHPYTHLTSILDKLGLARSLLVNLDRRKQIYNEEVMAFGSLVVSGLVEYVGRPSEEVSTLGVLTRRIANVPYSMLGVLQSDQNPILGSWTLFKLLIS